ncbi:hypothetical protein Dsin_017355 [Dipteronia sinensis]|uniref:Uncharacterized protein n=1 Tax=Dipteronia sinensis TaxID=43782 RepID=A0AAE0AEW0_9ROSI|nr:hypothetical protein Dsin_017355 [Dipteronia sinensis]
MVNANPICREVKVINDTKHVVEMKESRQASPSGFYHTQIQIGPSCNKHISATIFDENAKMSLRPTVIKIYLNGVYINQALTPQDFINFVQISFRFDESGNLLVTGVKATLYDQLSRIRIFRLLTGGDYSGREEEIIIFHEHEPS